ncbi:MAG: alpha-amlyase, partial [Epsilonproteobacteria bacterium]
FQYDIPVKRSKKTAYPYEFDPHGKTYNKVELKGEFNAWNPANSPLTFDGNIWRGTLMIAPGVYQYLVVADGQEMLDENNPEKQDNGIGGFNSLLQIPGVDPQKLPFIIPQDFKKGKVEINTTHDPKRVLAFWQNRLLSGNAMRFKKGEISIALPFEADTMHRSYLRVWVYNDEGLSNDVFIPLENGKPLIEAAQIERTDKNALMMYFMMVDRFADGDPENNFPVNDPEINPKANYYGGDMQGVLDNLNNGYFDSLGINTVWLSPITLNPEGAYGLYPDPLTKFSGYHGYWPIRSTVVDYRYGTMELLKEIVATAHQHDMNVLLDYVANHVHQEHPIYKEHPDWVTNLYLPDGSLNTERWDDHRLTTWFDVFLPTLDLSRPEVVEPMTDSALFWLQEAGIDGFRHDATKHVPEIFWETLTRKIKTEVIIPENRSVYQIGETYGSMGLINSYIGTGKLDGQFDFNVYDDAVATFARQDISFDLIQGRLEASLEVYGHHNLMGYITGNQDRSRFISYASGDVSFDEDAKLAGWTRDIEISDSTSYDKLGSLIAFITTIPGVPVIYYGDEYGVPGGNDPDNRRMMKFTHLDRREEVLRNTVSKLFKTRKKYPTLIYGETRFLLTEQDQWAYVRSWFGQHAVVVFNKSDQGSMVNIILPDDVEGKMKPVIDERRKITKDDQLISIELPANSFEIIVVK